MLAKKDKVAGLILDLIEASVDLAVSAIAPSALRTLQITNHDPRRFRRKYYVSQAAKQLRERGLIRFQRNSRGINCARLTANGRAELARYRLSKLKIKKPHRWDGQYRLVIFDIKEWKRGVRDRVRRWLSHLGFVRLQNSVWVYPYECGEVVALLKAHFHIGQEILYLTVISIENDRWLKKEFGLD